MKVPLVFFDRRPAGGAAEALFKAWIRAPLILKSGDEIEVDLPFGAFADTNPDSKVPTIRATGRIASLAVHADECLWYEFVAEAAIILPKHNSETIPKYPSLSMLR